MNFFYEFLDFYNFICDKQFNYKFLDSFFYENIDLVSFDFFDKINFSCCNDEFFFLESKDDFISIFSFFNKYFFSIFYFNLYFETYVPDQIIFKSFYERDFNYSDFDIISRTSSFDNYFDFSKKILSNTETSVELLNISITLNSSISSEKMKSKLSL